MKDSFFLSDAFQVDAFDEDLFHSAASEVLAADTNVFSELVAIAGLDPKVDLRYQNFDGVDLSGSDVRGFDFTGCSMKRVNWADCKKDDTTILADVVLDDAFSDDEFVDDEYDDFEAVELSYLEEEYSKTLRSLSPNEQVVWLYNLRREDPHRTEKLNAAIRLFHGAPDPFVAKNALAAVLRGLDLEAGLDVLLNLIGTSDRNDRRAELAFDALGALIPRGRKQVLHFAAQHMGTKHRINAALFLVKHVDLKLTRVIQGLSLIVRNDGDVFERMAYLSHLAMRFGEPFHQSVRDPLTGDVFDFGTDFGPDRLYLMGRRIANRIEGLRTGDRDLWREYVKRYGIEQNAIVDEVCNNIGKMREFGADYAFVARN